MGRLKILGAYIVVLILILIPDVVLEFFHMLWEFFLHVSHTLFEIIEVGLDLIVEHTFHTGLHQTQIVVFYILLFFIFWWFLKLWRAWPNFYQRTKLNFQNYRTRQKSQMQASWQNKSLFEKAKFIAIALLMIAGALSLLFM